VDTWFYWAFFLTLPWSAILFIFIWGAVHDGNGFALITLLSICALLNIVSVKLIRSHYYSDRWEVSKTPTKNAE
jgi:hypothetical protein